MAETWEGMRMKFTWLDELGIVLIIIAILLMQITFLMQLNGM